MTESTTGELRLNRPKWRVVAGFLRPVLITAAVIAYTVLLGARGWRLWAVAAVLVVAFGFAIVVSLLVLIAQLTGPAPAVTADGVRLRVRPWQRRLVTVPWDEITLLWVGHAVRDRYLCLSADPRGAHADDWDPRGLRFTSRFKPLAVSVPGSVPTDRVVAAVNELGAGRVEVSDRGPEGPPFAERRTRTGPLVVSWVLIGAFLLAGLPGVLGVPPLWGQPWAPGVTAASTLPDPCTVFAGQAGVRVSATDPELVQDGLSVRRCEYKVPHGTLTVGLELHHRTFGNATDAAHRSVEEISGSLGAPPVRVTGVGDEAWMAANPAGTTTMIDRGVARLVARRANVVLLILYGGEEEPAVAQAAVTEAARAALDSLDVS